MPTLRRSAPLIAAFLLSLPPSAAHAWDGPAGSPPAWQSYWIQTLEPVDVFVSADGSPNFGKAAANQFFRVDAPEQRGRLWVYDPLFNGWGWLPRASVRRVTEPTPDDVRATADPRAYLYAAAPTSRRAWTASSPAKAAGTLPNRIRAAEQPAWRSSYPPPGRPLPKRS